MKKILNTLLLAAFVTVLVIISYWLGQQAYSWMPAQGTAEAKRVDALFSFLVSLGTFVFLGIAGFILYSILIGRAGKGDFSDARPDRGNPKLEALWTGIPVLLVLWIAAQNFNIYQSINIQGLTPIVHMHIPSVVEPADAATNVNNNAKPASEQIEVVAKQWSWTFRYPTRNVTSTELHLPVNQSTSLAMRSEDVIHGFYVPEFRLKQDIIPNRIITYTLTPVREGKYRLHDSHFSGTYFAVNAANVYVESPEAYTQWLTQAAARKPSPAKNQAAAEYAQRQEYGFKSRWPTVRPAKPPVVNYSS